MKRQLEKFFSSFHFAIVSRFMLAGKLLSGPAFIALLGMAMGVASLTVAMAVVSGFEQTLKTAIIAVFGDMMLVKKGDKPRTIESMLTEIKTIAPEAETFTPFVQLEGIIAGSGQLAGVIIQGFEPNTVEKVLKIRERVIAGKFSFSRVGETPAALVGKTLAKKFNLKPGMVFKAVLPVPSRSDSTEFSPKIMTFAVQGVLDLGKAEYDERMIMTDLRSAQEFAGVGDAFSGVRMKLNNSDKAPEVSARLMRELGPQYWTMNWSDVNKNLFEAVRIERLVIFFVILVMVVAASFNIASNLFVNVLRRYADISILRALGFTERDVQKVFIYHGLFFGAIGTLAGILLGLVLCFAFVEVQKYIVLLPVETYRIDHVGVRIRPFDLIAIIVTSMAICLLASLVPARRGAKLDPVEGLRYE